jgi:hypothetical protein
MRCKLFLGILIATPAIAWAGAIYDQFGSGYEGVRWGLPLTDLVGMMPDGDHYFSTAPGQRDYAVKNDAPLLGVPRSGTRVQYHFGKGGGVESIAVGIPYDRYQQLLGALISQFGRYSQTTEVGSITYYLWKQDQQIQIAVRVTKDPRYGIAEFGIIHVTSSTPGASKR